MARSSPCIQEARPLDPVHARSNQSDPSLSRADRKIAITRATLDNLKQTTERLAVASTPAIALWQLQVHHYRPSVERIIRQSERRMLDGEPVPAGEKLVSLYEEHADIIIKGSRDTEYSHKLNLTTGRSGMVLDR